MGSANQMQGRALLDLLIFKQEQKLIIDNFQGKSFKT